MFGINAEEYANRISTLKDPFFTDKITQFSTYCSRNWSGDWQFTGKIQFENGDTGGEQKFKANDFSELLRKMERFMIDLKDK